MNTESSACAGCDDKEGARPSMVDRIMNDTKAWKNDSKELFTNIKKKIQAKYNQASI